MGKDQFRAGASTECATFPVGSVDRNQKGKQQMTLASDDDVKRQSAVYNDTVSRLRNSRPDMNDAETDAQGLAAVEASVYGADAKRDKRGNFLQQGIGAPGNETANHFAAIRKYEGKEAWDRAVGEIWRRDPERAKKLGLPQPARAT